MSYVMKQSRKAQILLLIFVKLDLVLLGHGEYTPHNLQGPEGMHKARMGGVRIGDVAHLQLFDVAQPLEGRGVNNLTLTLFKMDVPMQRIDDEWTRTLTR